MNEFIGYWNGNRYHDYAVVIEDGVLSVLFVFGVDSRKKNDIKFKREFGERFFGDSEFFVGLSGEFLTGVIKECDGKTLDEIGKVAEKYKEERAERRDRDIYGQKKWSALRDKFGGAVIGIDKDVDVYADGFSVRVLFASEMEFADRSKFLRENRKEFIKWVMAEIEDSKKIAKKIGSIKFYKPVEIINLRAQEVEVKFEVKMEGKA